MSKEKREQRVKEHAEWCWEQAQLRAAAAYQTLGAAVSIFENEKPDDLPQEEVAKIEAQIAEQKKRVEEYLMAEKDLYLERINGISA